VLTIVISADTIASCETLTLTHYEDTMIILTISMFIGAEMIETRLKYDNMEQCMVIRSVQEPVLNKLNESVLTGYSQRCSVETEEDNALWEIEQSARRDAPFKE